MASAKALIEAADLAADRAAVSAASGGFDEKARGGAVAAAGERGWRSLPARWGGRRRDGAAARQATPLEQCAQGFAGCGATVAEPIDGRVGEHGVDAHVTVPGEQSHGDVPALIVHPGLLARKSRLRKAPFEDGRF